MRSGHSSLNTQGYPTTQIRTVTGSSNKGKSQTDTEFGGFIKITMGIIVGIVFGFICSDLFTFIGPDLLVWFNAKFGG